MTRQEMNDRVEALEVLRNELIHDGNTVLKVLPQDPACDVVKVITLSSDRKIIFIETYQYKEDIKWYSYIIESMVIA